MKILFITGVYPVEYIEELTEAAYGKIQNAPNVFQWAVVEGLKENGSDYEIVSCPFLPSFPIHYKRLYTPRGPITKDGLWVGNMLRYSNMVAYKKMSIKRNLKNYIEDWVQKHSMSDERLVILTYTPYVPFIKAVKSLKKKYTNLVVASIVTDLVDDMMNFKSNRTIFKRLQCILEIRQTKKLYKYIDKFILLALPMLEKIPEARDKFIIVEGIATKRHFTRKDFPVNEERTILYTGTLEEFSGIRELLYAFLNVKNRNARLIICGSGPLETEIKKCVLKDPRIIYKGLVSREVAIKLQTEATLLINPRRPDGQITRFSFPSKTMEYLSSGTPMVGYKLEGIPEEYYDYYFTINATSQESLVATLEHLLTSSCEKLYSMAYDAYNFIMINKTAKDQVRKILEFIEE